MTRIRDLGVRDASCWSGAPDRDLGTRLVARVRRGLAAAWFAPGPAPIPRQTAIAEAIGFGGLAASDDLAPTPAELAETLPGGTSPLRVAVVTDRIESARWMLDRAPSLVRRRFEPFGGTLLHLAVEWDRPDMARLALAHGADAAARDRTYRGTPLQWVEHVDAAATGPVLSSWNP